MAIVLPTGRGDGNTWERMSATSERPAPTSMEAGMTLIWTDEPVKALAMCGATIPTKPIGPQKAVTAPAIRQLPAIEMFLILDGLAPAIAVYSSPKRDMSRPRLFTRASANPIRRAAVRITSPEPPVPMKLPADQL